MSEVTHTRTQLSASDVRCQTRDVRSRVVVLWHSTLRGRPLHSPGSRGSSRMRYILVALLSGRVLLTELLCDRR